MTCGPQCCDTSRSDGPRVTAVVSTGLLLAALAVFARGLPGVDPRVSLLPLNPRARARRKRGFYEHPSLSARISCWRLCAHARSAAHARRLRHSPIRVISFHIPIERGLVFPMALVPIALGALEHALARFAHAYTLAHWPHGALLPLLLMPCGAVLASCLGILGLGANGVTWFQRFMFPTLSIAPVFLAARSLRTTSCGSTSLDS